MLKNLKSSRLILIISKTNIKQFAIEVSSIEKDQVKDHIRYYSRFQPFCEQKEPLLFD